MNIRERVIAQIKEKESIDVSEFINICLNSNHGYYSNKNPIGKQNDFITAPEISQMFGEILGSYIINYWEENIKTYELARVIFNGDTLDSVGVRYKGNSTYYETHQVGSVKYPLNIDFDLIYEDQELLGYNKLKLSNSIFSVKPYFSFRY